MPHPIAPMGVLAFTDVILRLAVWRWRLHPGCHRDPHTQQCQIYSNTAGVSAQAFMKPPLSHRPDGVLAFTDVPPLIGSMEVASTYKWNRDTQQLRHANTAGYHETQQLMCVLTMFGFLVCTQTRHHALSHRPDGHPIAPMGCLLLLTCWQSGGGIHIAFWVQLPHCPVGVLACH